MPAVITGFNPATQKAGGAAFTLHVLGGGFLADATILMGGAGPTTFVSATELTAQVTPRATAGTTLVQVQQSNGFSSGKNYVYTQSDEELAAVAHMTSLSCHSSCYAPPDCVLPTPWPPAPVP